jgi:hypothetical protein
MGEYRMKEPYQTIAYKASMGWNEHLWLVPQELIEAYSDAIVQECIEIMMKEINNTDFLLSNPPKSSAIWVARNAIEKKFGVK